MRLQPKAIASSTMASVTSRHNKAPETSASVNPICKPALSKPSCRGRGANCSRALTTFTIFTLIIRFRLQKYKDFAEYSLAICKILEDLTIISRNQRLTPHRFSYNGPHWGFMQKIRNKLHWNLHISFPRPNNLVQIRDS